MDHRKLASEFILSLDTIASELLAFCGVRCHQDAEELSSPLFRWLDFRLRFVDPVPRQVFFSDKFPKDLPPDAATALTALVNAVVTGEDINRFQGKGLTEHHDTSSRKRRDRTDHLWADWGILHFHLTTPSSPEGDYYLPRSDWLLFAVFFRDWAAFIDVRPHKEKRALENPELVHTLIRNFPTVAEKCRLNGLLPPPAIVDSEIVKKSRIGGIVNPVVVDGVAYMPPGFGVTQASTSLKVSMNAIEAHRAAKMVAGLVADPKGKFQTEMTEKEKQNMSFTLSLTPRGLGIYEETSKKCWLLPRYSQSRTSTPFETLQNLMAPEWVCAAISDKLKGTAADI